MIPFNKPWSSGQELQNLEQAIANQAGPHARHFTQTCERWLEARTGARRAFLTPSCTAALEMAAILAGIGPGDEVIMASFTFPSMANAFVLRGATPVFVDIRPDTLNIDESLVESAITPRTRAIVAMHYGGVACEMDALMAIAEAHGLVLIEDAAHALGGSYKGRPLGSLGHLAALSFHRTKNIQCGEGGALLVNAGDYLPRAEIVRENGTNRASFDRGEITSYAWTDLGSSFILSEFGAAFLWAQLPHLDEVISRRRRLWQLYQRQLHGAEAPGIHHTAHVFPLLADSPAQRAGLQEMLWHQGIQAVPHYQPLHSSPAGARFGRQASSLQRTERLASCLLRLPLWVGLAEETVAAISECIRRGQRPAAHPLPQARPLAS